jgi:hypothetical protein
VRESITTMLARDKRADPQASSPSGPGRFADSSRRNTRAARALASLILCRIAAAPIALGRKRVLTQETVQHRVLKTMCPLEEAVRMRL